MSLQEMWTYEGPASLVILFFTHCATYLLLWVLPSRIGGERFARTSIKKTRCVVTYCTHVRLFSSQFSCLASILFFFAAEFPHVRLGLPMHMGDNSSGEQGMANIPTLVQGAGYKDYTSKQKLLEEAPSAPRSAGSLMLLLGNLLGPRVLHPSGKELRHHCLPYDPGASSTQRSSILFLNAWICRFQVNRSCQTSKIVSPRVQTSSLRG